MISGTATLICGTASIIETQFRNLDLREPLRDQCDNGLGVGARCASLGFAPGQQVNWNILLTAKFTLAYLHLGNLGVGDRGLWS